MLFRMFRWDEVSRITLVVLFKWIWQTILQCKQRGMIPRLELLIVVHILISGNVHSTRRQSIFTWVGNLAFWCNFTGEKLNEPSVMEHGLHNRYSRAVIGYLGFNPRPQVLSSSAEILKVCCSCYGIKNQHTTTRLISHPLTFKLCHTLLVSRVCPESSDDRSCSLRILTSFRARTLGKIAKWLLSDKAVGHVLSLLTMNSGVSAAHNFLHLDAPCKCNIDKCAFNARLTSTILIFRRISHS